MKIAKSLRSKSDNISSFIMFSSAILSVIMLFVGALGFVVFNNKLANAETFAIVAPSITSVSPSSGSIAGGNTITINGNNFSYNQLNFTAVSTSAEASHTCGVASGQAYCWGKYDNGQLGGNEYYDTARPSPVDITGVLANKTITNIATGSDFTLALASDGTLYSWGGNSNGQLGNNSTTDNPTPVAVDMSGALAGKTITAISAGTNFSLALASDGMVFAWGSNNNGQLGNNSTTDSSAPVAVIMNGALSDKTIKSISAGGSYAIALATDGTAFGWGYNYYGQLGNNSTSQSLVPVAVTTSGVLSGKTISQITAGDSSVLVLTSDNKLFSWGYNGSGQLGNNSTTDSHIPIAVTMSGALAGKTVTSIAAGLNHFIASTLDGIAYDWGYNGNGQLGNNSTTDSHIPIAVDTTNVMSGKLISSVVASANSSFAISASGAIYSWGANDTAQLGDGTTYVNMAPDTVSNTQGSVTIGGNQLTNVTYVSSHKITGTVPAHAAGLTNLVLTDYDSQTTKSTYRYVYSSTPSMTNLSPNNGYANSGTVVTISGSNLSTNDTITFGGSNAVIKSVSSDGSSMTVTAPLHVVGAVNVVALDQSGQGQTLANGFTYQSAPFTFMPNSGYISGGDTVTILGSNLKNISTVLFGGLNAVIQSVASDGNSMVVTTPVYSGLASQVDISLIDKSNNTTTIANGFDYEELPLTISSISPSAGPIAGGQEVTVEGSGFKSGSLHFTKIAHGESEYSCGIADGKIYCWGPSYYIDQIGDNWSSVSATPVPVDMSGVLAGKTIVDLATGSDHVLALASDGTVYSWGQNEWGQLGNGTENKSYTPVPVIMSGALAGKTVTAISANDQYSLVLTSDGKVYGWGYGAAGQLGNGAQSISTYPVAVYTGGVLNGKTITAISAGNDHAIALDSDGKAYTWGNTQDGALGNGINYNWGDISDVPVAVYTYGSLWGKTITSVKAGSYNSMVLTSDGGVYAWAITSTVRWATDITTM
jgi:alpha-tubulin suppressor-like RCC1 family protein